MDLAEVALVSKRVKLTNIAATTIRQGANLGDDVGKSVGKGTHLVYEGLDAAGNVKYIGITGRDAAVRFGEHLNSGTARSLLDYRVINGATGLSKTQARN